MRVCINVRQLTGGTVEFVEEGIYDISLVLTSIRKCPPVIFLMPDQTCFTPSCFQLMFLSVAPFPSSIFTLSSLCSALALALSPSLKAFFFWFSRPFRLLVATKPCLFCQAVIDFYLWCRLLMNRFIAFYRIFIKAKLLDSIQKTPIYTIKTLFTVLFLYRVDYLLLMLS